MTRATTSWRQKARAFGINLGLMAASVVVFLLVCELFVFRFILLPTDLPHNIWMDGLVRMRPGDTGTWRIGDEIASRFSINAQGWNTSVADFRRERTPGVPRVAVVGDSYVTALMIDVDSSFPELLADATGWEVYRFGIPGGPLSQHLKITEQAAMNYAPDWVVVLIVHNDFDESFLFRPGRYTSSFLKLAIEDGEVVGEIEPEPYAPDWRDTVRRLATVRYLYYRQQLRETVRSNSMLMRLLFGTSENEDGARFEANIDTSQTLAYWPEIEAAADYVLGRLDEVVRGQGSRLLLVMDGNRQAIYDGVDPKDSVASSLNRLVARLAMERDIPFLDLHDAFAADWAAHGERFEFVRDTHWNARTHALVAREIETFLGPLE